MCAVISLKSYRWRNLRYQMIMSNFQVFILTFSVELNVVAPNSFNRIDFLNEFQKAVSNVRGYLIRSYWWQIVLHQMNMSNFRSFIVTLLVQLDVVAPNSLNTIDCLNEFQKAVFNVRGNLIEILLVAKRTSLDDYVQFSRL